MKLNVQGFIMKGMDRGGPNIEDVMQKGFAELKIGEGNIVVGPQEETPPEPSPEPSPKIEYAKKIHAEENRESFVVEAPIKESSPTDENTETAPQHKPEILKEPTTKIGDDFDVQW